MVLFFTPGIVACRLASYEVILHFSQVLGDFPSFISFVLIIFLFDIVYLYQLFLNFSELKRITRLSMDTTFCNERIPTLPTREQCAEFVLRKSREWLSRGPQSSAASNGSATHFYASGAEECSVPSAAHCVHLVCTTRYILSGLYELLECELVECVHVNVASFSDTRCGSALA